MQGELLQQILLRPLPGDEPDIGLDVTGWRLLVGCCMLNQTSRMQVNKVWPAFFRRFPRAESCIFSGSIYFDEAFALLRPLGFGGRRTETIHKLSAWWHYERTIGFDVLDAPGTGQYAKDSWEIYVCGNTDIVPQDKELRRYLGLRALPTTSETVRRR